MLDFDFKLRHMKEEKDISLMYNNKGYSNYCCISKSR